MAPRRLMTGMGTSPNLSHQSPSFHSTSYIPKMEAAFMRDFICCDHVFPTMHDLLQHYEENHNSQVSPPVTRGAALTMAGSSAQRLSSVRNLSAAGQPTAHATQGPGQAAQPGRQTGGTGMGGIQQMMHQHSQQHQSHQHQHHQHHSQQHQQHARHPQHPQHSQQQQQQQQQQSGSAAQKQAALSQMNDDMDAVGDMEMDEPVGPMDMDDSHRTIQQTRQIFGQQRPRLHLNSSNLAQQALRASTPTTPAASGYGFASNPTVSSVNTPPCPPSKASPTGPSRHTLRTRRPPPWTIPTTIYRACPWA